MEIKEGIQRVREGWRKGRREWRREEEGKEGEKHEGLSEGERESRDRWRQKQILRKDVNEREGCGRKEEGEERRKSKTR